MPIYRCNECNVEFTKKWNYNYHVSRKIPCKIGDTVLSDSEISSDKINREKCKVVETKEIESKKEVANETKNKEIETTCQHCHKTYSSKSNLNKHLKICRFVKRDEISKVKDLSDDSPIMLNPEIKDTLTQLKKELTEIKSILHEKNNESVMQTYNINNHFTFLTQIQQNTNVTNFGSEIMDALPSEFCVGLFSSPKDSVPRLIERIHFDEERPSNMNIILPNKDLPFVYVYENDKWVIANKQTALNELMDTNLHRVDSLYDHFKESLGESTIHSYQKYSYEMEQNIELKTDIQKDISYVLERGSKQIIEKMERPLLETPYEYPKVEIPEEQQKQIYYIRDHPGFDKNKK